VAWEWVAPVVTGASGAVGVFFTWLAGVHGRAHAERMLKWGREAERQATLVKERRDAYLAVLRVVELDLRRARYTRSGRLDKLEQVEAHWNKARRVEMTMDAIVGVSAFGSEDAQRFADQWRAAVESDDQNALHEAAERIRQQVRYELNPLVDG
jgi:hypothetical protein